MSAVTTSLMQRGKRRILLSCHVIEDGVGDFYHLVDLIQHEDEFMPGFTKDVMITTEHDETITRNFDAKFKQLGYSVILVGDDSDFTENVNKNPCKNAYIVRLKKLSHKKKNQIILKADEVYSANISISCDIFNGEKFERFSIPKLLITEHRGGSPRDNPTTLGSWTEIPMNLHSGTRSLFLTNEDRSDPAKQLSDVLRKPKNNALKAALLEGDISCEAFLRDSLFVPCYLQHNDLAIVNYINITTESPLSKQYNSSVFFINRVNDERLEAAVLHGFLSKEVGKIVIKTKSGEKEIINPHADKKAKTVKLVCGYRIEDDEDYKVLFHCAQYFAGASGDKTIETILSNGLWPLFIPHDRHKTRFIEDAITFNENFGYLKKLSHIDDLLRQALDKGFYSLQKVEDALSKTLRLSKQEYPEIVQKWNDALDRGVGFNFDGKEYQAPLEYDYANMLRMAEWFVKKYEGGENDELCDQFVDCLKSDDQEAWGRFLTPYREKEGAVEMAKKIADAVNRHARIELDGRIFSSKFSRKQGDELLEKFSNIYPPLLLKHMVKLSREISQSLDHAFYKEWNALCATMRNENNLHKKMPTIINKVFSELLDRSRAAKPDGVRPVIFSQEQKVAQDSPHVKKKGEHLNKGVSPKPNDDRY